MKTTAPYATDIRLLQEELNALKTAPKLGYTNTLVAKAISNLLEDYIADIEYFEDSYYEELAIAKELEYDIDYEYALSQQNDYDIVIGVEPLSEREQMMLDEDTMYFYAYEVQGIYDSCGDTEYMDLMLGTLEAMSSEQLLWYLKNCVFCKSDSIILMSSCGEVVQLRYDDSRIMDIIVELTVFS